MDAAVAGTALPSSSVQHRSLTSCLGQSPQPQRPRRQQGYQKAQHAYEHQLQNQHYPLPLSYPPQSYESPARAPPAQAPPSQQQQGGDAVIRDVNGNAV